jgi:hypothetical protein
VSGFAALFLGSLLAGCSSAPRVIPLSYSAEEPPPAPRSIDNYPDAFRAIASVMSRQLNLPIPRVALYLYPNRDAFEEGLRAEAHMSPELAHGTAGVARGAGGQDKIVVNEAALVHTPWPDRVRFLAHEFTHTIQFDLAGGRHGSSQQWLREGYADWASFRVMDALGLETYGALRAQRLARMRRVGDLKSFPPLAELSTVPEWLTARRTQGPEVTYFQAFLAVELLIERHGAQAPIAYFRRYARSDNRSANFRAAFGQELSAFDREFAAHLQSLLH